MKTKILLFTAIFFCAGITTNAQITEGRYLLGGSVGYNSSKSQQNSVFKSEALYTNIQFGKVVKDNTVAGIFLSYGYTKNNSNDVTSSKSNQYGAGVFYKKYKQIVKDLYFFGEVDAVYNYSKTTQGNMQIGSDGAQTITNGGSVSFTPGISYSVCKRMQMELLMPNIVSAYYGASKNESTSSLNSSISTSKSSGLSVNANFNTTVLNSFGIGFKFLLGK
jgi:hypothetical protein